MRFPVSGVEVHPLLPPAVAFVVSFFTSMGGVSGAFLLLPFQMSVLGFTNPSVSPTNLIFNIVAIPSGVYRYIREGRMAWPLMWIIIIGTLPGVVLGAIVRVRYLPDPRAFKLFVGLVLAYLGGRMVYELWRKRAGTDRVAAMEARFSQHAKPPPERTPARPTTGTKAKVVARTKTGDRVEVVMSLPRDAAVRTVAVGLSRVEFEFYGERFAFNTWAVLGLTFVVGVIGGTYGIGGGAIIAPFLLTFFELPVYAIAGAALMGTFLTSVAGVIVYTVIAPMYASSGLAIEPDWALGLLFGAGGAAGMYLGARVQKRVPGRAIRVLLALVITGLAVRYVLSFFG